MPQPTQPLIGLTCSLTTSSTGARACQVGQAYVNAILKAGGLPLILPTAKDAATAGALSRLDGLLLTGGGDIDPRRFAGKPHPRIYGLSPDRDQLEFALVEDALAHSLPVLAICRGAQILNVVFGGSLHTDIADQFPNALRHDWFPDIPRDYLAHPVQLSPGSRLRQIFGQETIAVNSLHHQGIAEVGAGLLPTAHAPDGLVEALEVIGAGFALGVQWHPECLPDSPMMAKLFQAFIDACR